MADTMFDLALQETESSSPAVRAGALMRLARVLSASNRSAARKMFERALGEVREVSGGDGESLLQNAAALAAAVAPDLLGGIPLGGPGPAIRKFTAETLARTMLRHGHVDAAYEFVMRYDDPATFPVGVIHELLELPGDERQLTVFRYAIDAWRVSRNRRFPQLFCWKWKMLPPDEARTVVREIVRAALEEPDQPITASYDSDGTTQITSRREHSLFQVLHILRSLDEPLAQTLIASHEQLAKAAMRFPNGFASVMEEAEVRRKAVGAESRGGGFVMAGNAGDFPYLRALRQASLDGEYGPAMDFAHQRYFEDISPERPNQALKESWPSSCMFRSIAYSAAKKLGSGAATYLDRIPDRDQRLFARIELAAALAGLPELQGTQRVYHPRPIGAPTRMPRTS